MKKCPYCAEEIQDEATKCKHCGEFLNIFPDKKTVAKDNKREKDSKIVYKCLVRESCIKNIKQVTGNMNKVSLGKALKKIKEWIRSLLQGADLVKVTMDSESTEKDIRKYFADQGKELIEFSKLKSDKLQKLRCPRCGYENFEGEFKNAYDDGTCCCLALLMILPAIFYYFFRSNKKICPKCNNIF